jgi:hypothetical protein
MASPDNGDRIQRPQLLESERHELLADDVRRETLSVLQRVEGTVTLMDIAHTIWATTAIRDDQPDIESVQICLHHAHLPKLESYGLITYDASRKEIVENRVDGDVLAT